jgi:hypothetical protein
MSISIELIARLGLLWVLHPGVKNPLHGAYKGPRHRVEILEGKGGLVELTVAE